MFIGTTTPTRRKWGHLKKDGWRQRSLISFPKSEVAAPSANPGRFCLVSFPYRIFAKPASENFELAPTKAWRKSGRKERFAASSN